MKKVDILLAALALAGLVVILGVAGSVDSEPLGALVPNIIVGLGLMAPASIKNIIREVW